MKEDKIKKIYKSYFVSDWTSNIPEEEKQEVLNEYKNNRKVRQGYKIEEGNVYKDNNEFMSCDELKARMEVLQAKDIHSIKSSVTFFVVLTVISMIVSFIYVLVVFTG